MAKILVVDDEKEICDLIRLYLEDAGFDVVFAYSGPGALRETEVHKPDLIVLDLMLPGMDGMEVCRTLRRQNPVPIIMLTAKGDELDRILGFEMGADDYVIKPFYPRELVARVKSILRRKRRDMPDEDRLSTGPLMIDRIGVKAVFGTREVTLTPKELDLLWHLTINRDKVVSRDELLAVIWNWEYAGNTRAVDAHIKRLRRKLQQVGAGQCLRTVWGTGYKLQID